MEEKADNTLIYYDSFSTNENVTGFYCQFLKWATLKSGILIQLFILEVAFATFTIVPTKAESFLLFVFFYSSYICTYFHSEQSTICIPVLQDHNQHVAQILARKQCVYAS